MEQVMTDLPPGDPTLVNNIVSHLKSQGIFDEFRHDCLADVDTKPSYQNLSQRVDGYVSKFLSNETWNPDLNKNELRNKLRRNIDESGMLSLGAEHVVEQVINPKINQVFLPKIIEVVQQFLGIKQFSKSSDSIPVKKQDENIRKTETPGASSFFPGPNSASSVAIGSNNKFFVTELQEKSSAESYKKIDGKSVGELKCLIKSESGEKIINPDSSKLDKESSLAKSCKEILSNISDGKINAKNVRDSIKKSETVTKEVKLEKTDTPGAKSKPVDKKSEKSSEENKTKQIDFRSVIKDSKSTVESSNSDSKEHKLKGSIKDTNIPLSDPKIINSKAVSDSPKYVLDSNKDTRNEKGDTVKQKQSEKKKEGKSNEELKSKLTESIQHKEKASSGSESASSSQSSKVKNVVKVTDTKSSIKTSKDCVKYKSEGEKSGKIEKVDSSVSKHKHIDKKKEKNEVRNLLKEKSSSDKLKSSNSQSKMKHSESTKGRSSESDKIKQKSKVESSEKNQSPKPKSSSSDISKYEKKEKSSHQKHNERSKMEKEKYAKLKEVSSSQHYKESSSKSKHKDKSDSSSSNKPKSLSGKITSEDARADMKKKLPSGKIDAKSSSTSDKQLFSKNQHSQKSISTSAESKSKQKEFSEAVSSDDKKSKTSSSVTPEFLHVQKTEQFSEKSSCPSKAKFSKQNIKDAEKVDKKNSSQVCKEEKQNISVTVESTSVNESTDAEDSSCLAQTGKRKKYTCKDGVKCNTPPPSPPSSSEHIQSPCVQVQSQIADESRSASSTTSSDQDDDDDDLCKVKVNAPDKSPVSEDVDSISGPTSEDDIEKLIIACRNATRENAHDSLSDVSSVHTSELSSFDDEVSLSTSDEEMGEGNNGHKEKIKISLKEAEEILKRVECGEESSINQIVLSKCSNDQENAGSYDDKTSSPVTEKQLLQTETKRELRRKRKLNPRYASDEYTSIFNQGESATEEDKNVSPSSSKVVSFVNYSRKKDESEEEDSNDSSPNLKKRRKISKYSNIDQFAISSGERKPSEFSNEANNSVSESCVDHLSIRNKSSTRESKNEELTKSNAVSEVTTDMCNSINSKASLSSEEFDSDDSSESVSKQTKVLLKQKKKSKVNGEKSDINTSHVTEQSNLKNTSVKRTNNRHGAVSVIRAMRKEENAQKSSFTRKKIYKCGRKQQDSSDDEELEENTHDSRANMSERLSNRRSKRLSRDNDPKFNGRVSTKGENTSDQIKSPVSTNNVVTRSVPDRSQRKSKENAHPDQHKPENSQRSSQWYDFSDLYKPRPVITSSTRRSIVRSSP